MYPNCSGLQRSRAPGDKPENVQDNSLRQSDIPTDLNRRKIDDKEQDAGQKHVKGGVNSNPDWSHLEGVFLKGFKDSVNPETIKQFLTALCEMLTSYIVSEADPSTKVLDFHQPHQLQQMMSHCLDIQREPVDLEQILSDCRETLKYCVKTGHPHFFNQLSTGIDVVGVAGSWLTAVSNTNMFTYEVAPVFTLMEKIIFTRMAKLIGWDDADAIFAPGGAVSNLYGVLLARHHALPDVKQNGLQQDTRKPVVFTSEQSHFSIKRAAALLGIGTNNVINIRCHRNGKMDVMDLREQMMIVKKRGGTVIMVNATCGTTVLGAFDPVNEIADICEEYGAWLHVDAAWGGGILLSPDYKHLFHGIHKVDSITWNPHKMMGVPLQCSAILTKHKGLLKECNSMNAAYLFQKDKNYDTSYDTGDMTVQCGRHNDIFKLWLMWRVKGDSGFEEQISKNFRLAFYLRDKVKERAGFHLVVDKIEAPNVCFWYVPPAWRTRPLDKIKDAHLHKVAPQIKAKMMEAGSLMVQYQPLGDLPNLFRVAISNPILTQHDLDYLLNEIDDLGKEIPTPLDWND